MTLCARLGSSADQALKQGDHPKTIPAINLLLDRRYGAAPQLSLGVGARWPSVPSRAGRRRASAEQRRNVNSTTALEAPARRRPGRIEALD